jgi:hypothetical protein
MSRGDEQKTDDGFREVYVNVDPEWTSPNE